MSSTAVMAGSQNEFAACPPTLRHSRTPDSLDAWWGVQGPRPRALRCRSSLQAHTPTPRQHCASQSRSPRAGRRERRPGSGMLNVSHASTTASPPNTPMVSAHLRALATPTASAPTRKLARRSRRPRARGQEQGAKRGERQGETVGFEARKEAVFAAHVAQRVPRPVHQ
eukprot:2650353-Rhodomonas_salina.2